MKLDIKRETNELFAFLKKDMLISISYKANILNFIIFSIFIISFISFFSSGIETLIPFENSNQKISIFGFFLSGAIIVETSLRLVSSMTATVRFYQMSGIVEEIFSEKDRNVRRIIYSSTYSSLIALSRVIFYLLLAIFIEKELFSSLDLYSSLASCLFIVLTYFGLTGIGLIACSYTILFKQGNLVITMFLIVSLFFSNSFFLVDQLPPQIQFVRYLSPISYLLDYFRDIDKFVSIPANFNEIFFQILFMNMIYFIFGVISVKKAINIAKVRGNLIFY